MPAPTPNDEWSRSWPQGWTVRHVAETASTNADVLAAAAELPDRSVLTTDHQTAGRGRLDRQWDAPPSANLLVSMLFRNVSVTGGDNAGDHVRRVGLAAHDACRCLVPANIRLKWPNDVLADGRKLAGVLAQVGNVCADGRGDVVVGVGINVGWAPDGAARLGPDVDRPTLLAGLLAAYDALPATAAAFHERYRTALATLGQSVRIERPDGELVGRAVDVDPDGRLVIVDDSSATHRVGVGDVIHLRPIEP